jgi:hypothetical protein
MRAVDLKVSFGKIPLVREFIVDSYDSVNGFENMLRELCQHLNLMLMGFPRGIVIRSGIGDDISRS